MMDIYNKLIILFGYFLTLLLQCHSQRIVNIGNDLKAASSGVDVKGATFLMNDAVLSEGVVFAFSAFFRTDSAVWLQIWRPMASSGSGEESNETGSGGSNVTNTRTFMLVSHLRVIPAVRFQREDIYIESRLTERCTRVHTGDRIGIYIESSPGAIAYTFDPTQPKALAFTSEFQNLTYGIRDYVTFDTLTFPYDFSLSAYIDTDLSGYRDDDTDPYPECPRGLLIPEYGAITLPATTPAPLPTGRHGSTGATGPVGEAGAMGATGLQGPSGQPGNSGFRGQYGATGFTGLNGPVGATGYSGKDGKQGVTGLPGDRGYKGPIGPPGPPGDNTGRPPLLETKEEHTLSSPMLILGILIWLLIITLLLLILIICLIIAHKRRQDAENRAWTHSNSHHNPAKKNNSFLFATTTDKAVISSRPEGPEISNESWIASLKEETESQYSVDTINDYGGYHGNNNNSMRKMFDKASNDGNSMATHDKDGHLNQGADFEQDYMDSPHSEQDDDGFTNVIYENMDVPKHELTNY